MLADLEANPGIRGIPAGNLGGESGVTPFVHFYLLSFPDGKIA
jgi:hypothetical protein